MKHNMIKGHQMMKEMSKKVYKPLKNAHIEISNNLADIDPEIAKGLLAQLPTYMTLVKEWITCNQETASKWAEYIAANKKEYNAECFLDAAVLRDKMRDCNDVEQLKDLSEMKDRFYDRIDKKDKDIQVFALTQQAMVMLEGILLVAFVGCVFGGKTSLASTFR